MLTPEDARRCVADRVQPIVDAIVTRVEQTILDKWDGCGRVTVDVPKPGEPANGLIIAALSVAGWNAQWCPEGLVVCEKQKGSYYD